MTLILDEETAELLRTLVHERIKRIGPEFHHTRTNNVREELQRQRKKLEALEASLDQVAAT